MDFRVDLPQIDSPQRRSNYNRKYIADANHSNQAGFMARNSHNRHPFLDSPKKPVFSNPSQTYSPRLLEKYRQLQELAARSGSTERRNAILSKFREPPPVLRPLSIKTQSSETPVIAKIASPPKLKDHPIFAQPRYTKMQPMHLLSNPLTGLAEDPFNKKRLVGYGER